jgi:hypothetical protein
VYTMLTETGAYNQGLSFWDPLTYAIASDESLADYTTKMIAVVEEEGPEIGRTKDSQNGGQVRVAISANADRFVETYLSTINGGQKITIDWATAKPTPKAIITVTISGGQCVSEDALQVPAGLIGVKLIDKDPAIDAGLAIVTMDADKSFADLVAWTSTDPPPWTQIQGFVETTSGNETMQTVVVQDKPIYLVCFDTTSSYVSKIGALGPIEAIK